MASFSRIMELEADGDGMMLMARAGFHPDFVPALHHFLQSQQFEESASDLFHPSWEVRDESLRRMQVRAAREYDRLWPDRYLSPGRNPPKVVYAGSPRAKLSPNGVLEVLVPLHCENLSGSVEVILDLIGLDFGPLELRQFTGCTSFRTRISFILPPIQSLRNPAQTKIDLSVLDDSGAILTRAPSAGPAH